MSARKIGLLVLIVAFAATVETAWNVRGDFRIGPEGCRVMGGRFYGPSWSFESSDEIAVAPGTAPRLEVENAFGEVRLTKGAPGIVKVRLRKVVYLATEDKARAFAERVALRLTGDDERVRIGTNRDELGREDTGFETHLEIEAPAEAVARVHNSHGRVELSGVAAADVTSSYDGVTLERVAGSAKLEVRHGDVSVDGVGGELELNARHGSVAVSGVAGAARLDVQHGSLDVHRAAGLELDLAYGELTVEGVGGDLVVRAQHAAVHAVDVRGRAQVETSFGDVRLERVGGELVARVEHGGLTASDVSGAAQLETTHNDVRLERVAGHVDVTVEHGGVDARGLAQGARIHASGADVTLDGFAGPVEVVVERGSARLDPGVALAAPLVAQVTHGEVQLGVPDGSRFDLEAESRNGRVEASLDGLTVDDTGRRGQRASGRHAGGGVSVRLKADGDVTLEPRPARSRDAWTAARPHAGGELSPEKPAPAQERARAKAPPAEAPLAPPAPPTPPTPVVPQR